MKAKKDPSLMSSMSAVAEQHMNSKLASYVDEGLLPPLDFRYHKANHGGMSRIMSDLGDQGYNPNRDPEFLGRLSPSDYWRLGGQTAGIGGALGGLGLTGYNLSRNGRMGWLGPLSVLGGLGLAELASPN